MSLSTDLAMSEKRDLILKLGKRNSVGPYGYATLFNNLVSSMNKLRTLITKHIDCVTPLDQVSNVPSLAANITIANYNVVLDMLKNLTDSVDKTYSLIFERLDKENDQAVRDNVSEFLDTDEFQIEPLLDLSQKLSEHLNTAIVLLKNPTNNPSFITSPNEELDSTLVEHNNQVEDIVSAVDRLPAETRNSTPVPNNLSQHPSSRLFSLDDIQALLSITNPRQKPLDVFEPKLELPKFGGDPLDFPCFWQSFSSLIHENDQIPVQRKANWLINALEGEAKTFLQGRSITSHNYFTVIEEFKETFQHSNLRRIITRNLSELPKSGNSSADWQLTLQKIESLVNQLQGVGLIVKDQPEDLYAEMILSKFPRIVSIEVVRKKSHNTTIRQLIRLIREAFIIVDEINSLKSTSFLNPNPSFTHFHVQNQPLHKKLLVKSEKFEGVRPPTPSFSFTCCFCGRSGHKTFACRTIVNPADRRKLLIDQNRCLICVSPSHQTRDCNKPKCSNCNYAHHSSLCSRSSHPTSTNARASNTPSNPVRTRSQTAGNSRNRSVQLTTTAIDDNEFDQQEYQEDYIHEASIFNISRPINSVFGKFNDCEPDNEMQAVLMLAEIDILNHKSSEFEKTVVLFDSGAQHSSINLALADKLGLPRIEKTKAAINTYGENRLEYISYNVSLCFKDRYNNCHTTNIYTAPKVASHVQSIFLSPEDKFTLSQKQLPLAHKFFNGDVVQPLILIGHPKYDLFVESSNSLIFPSGLRATETVFGYSLHGRVRYPTDCSRKANPSLPMSAMLIDSSNTSCELTNDALVTNLFEIENMNTNDNLEPVSSELAEKYFEKIEIKNNIITAPFPLNSKISYLHNNYIIAFQRLHALWKQLQKNQELKFWYSKIMLDYASSNIVSPFCSQSMPSDIPTNSYYMPHSAVWRPEKSVPLRIVFDASSKLRNEISLNDTMETGIHFNNHIFDIILRVRACHSFIACDIQSAFTQIHLTEGDKNLCKFLWLKNPSLPPCKNNIEEWRFNRLPFGITASPSILSMSLTKFLLSKKSSLASSILKNIYVDNIFITFSEEKDLIHTYRQLKILFQEISMNVREFMSNNTQFNNMLPSVDSYPHNTKILGLSYSPSTDQISFSINLPKKDRYTRREALSLLHTIFDPIGVLSPILIKLKISLRKIFEETTSWNDIAPEHLCKEWNIISNDLQNCNISLPRRMKIEPNSELYAISDASSSAIACVLYIKTGNHFHFVAAKTKLTPKKGNITIPKSELLSILLATKLIDSVLKAFESPINSIHLINDSSIALCWTLTPNNKIAWVDRRVREIQQTIDSWKNQQKSVLISHVSSEFNNADIATRGCSVKELHESNWFHGLVWQYTHPQALTPANKLKHPCEPIAMHENSVLAITKSVHNKIVDDIYDKFRSNYYSKNIRKLANIFKICKFWIQKIRPDFQFNSCLSQISNTPLIEAKDLLLAEEFLIKRHQSCITLQDLQKRFPKNSFFKDQSGIVRLKSRLQNAPIPYDTANPILLIGNSKFCTDYINQVHISKFHMGPSYLAAVIKQRFFIPKLGATVRSITSRCVICKRQKGQLFTTPPLPPLPEDRVTYVHPFYSCGIDAFGPIRCKNKKAGKAYAILFTCLVIRAIHIEIVSDLTGQEFLAAFIRFISRRGTPKIIRSDNGGNFVAGQKILAELFKEGNETNESVASYSSKNNIIWYFNPPRSPWMGGVWERLIQDVKSAFYKTVINKALTMSELQTIFTSIEGILNSRPISSQPFENYPFQVIRPIDFLHPKIELSLPDPSLDESNLKTPIQHDLFNAQNATLKLSNEFWHSWVSNYLTSLRSAYFSSLKQSKQRFQPALNEIVLVQQDLISRNRWPLAVITKLNIGSDGFIRSVNVRFASGKTVCEPICRLVPLEVRSNSCPAQPSPAAEEAAAEAPALDPEHQMSQPNLPANTMDDQPFETVNQRQICKT